MAHSSGWNHLRYLVYHEQRWMASGVERHLRPGDYPPRGPAFHSRVA